MRGREGVHGRYSYAPWPHPGNILQTRATGLSKIKNQSVAPARHGTGPVPRQHGAVGVSEGPSPPQGPAPAPGRKTRQCRRRTCSPRARWRWAL
ncbi:hypothetical protein FGB62_41g13 [Gracilaria domingensis]|nr:hypothetical protein FGB62_41g13 [Gracilaria domingensis]